MAQTALLTAESLGGKLTHAERLMLSTYRGDDSLDAQLLLQRSLAQPELLLALLDNCGGR